ncbi:MAG: LacI family DNA-binding transcriptional regulator, partial [Solirubrobacterales bacterium]|nr:LacI family DNA-binding transcriptional regulator [Solirubrobacterales bacterium]
MREVAERAGVALSSVSRVLSGHPAVSESLRRRVLMAVSEMDYEPDFTAMSLRRGSTMTVAFLVRDIASPLFSDLVKSAERELRRQGYSLLMMNSDGDPDRDAAHIRLFARRRVDGLILSLASETHPETLAALKSLRAPVVLIDRRVPEIQASTVLSDHYHGLRAATRQLADQGHRRIALITGPHEVLASRERVRGYKAGLRSAGITAEDRLLRIGNYSVEFGNSQTTQLLSEPDPPTAVIAGAVML